MVRFEHGRIAEPDAGLRTRSRAVGMFAGDERPRGRLVLRLRNSSLDLQ